MFRILQKLFASASTEQIHLAERLQSAKWLGWDLQTEAGAEAAQAAGENSSQELLGMTASGKPA